MGGGGVREIRRKERIGCRDCVDVNQWNGFAQRRIHCLDKCVRRDGVAGVGRVNTIQREQSAEESGIHRVAVNDRWMRVQIFGSRVDVDQVPPAAATCWAITWL